MPALDLDKSHRRSIVTIEPPRDAGRPERAAPAVDRSLSIPLEEQAVLAAVKSALEAQPSVRDQDSRDQEIFSFEGFTIDLAGRSLRDCRSGEVPLTRSEFGRY